MTKSLDRTLLFLAPITLFAFGGGDQSETTATLRCSSPAASAVADALTANSTTTSSSSWEARIETPKSRGSWLIW